MITQPSGPPTPPAVAPEVGESDKPMFEVTVRCTDGRGFVIPYEALDVIDAMLQFKHADIVFDDEIEWIGVKRIRS